MAPRVQAAINYAGNAITNHCKTAYHKPAMNIKTKGRAYSGQIKA